MLFFGTAAKAQNYSLSFDGVDDYVSIGTEGFSSGNEAITMSAWFYRSDAIVGSAEYLISYGNFTGQLFALGVYNGDYLFVTFDTGPYDAISTTSVPFNTWHHVVGVHSGDGQVNIYFNGTLVHSADVSTPNVSLANGKIGSAIDGSQVWNGKIDDIRIYNRALSPEEVKALYELEKPKK